MTTQILHDTDTDRSIDALNALLRGELSAVETYEQALAKFDEVIPQELRDCLRSHRMRTERLTQRIVELGGTPSEGSGLWGAFARLFEGSAKLLGQASTVAALEEGEDHGMELYENRLTDLDPESLRLVGGELQFEQRSTHAMVRDLKNRIS